jgi:hypothetical protein
MHFPLLVNERDAPADRYSALLRTLSIAAPSVLRLLFETRQPMLTTGQIDQPIGDQVREMRRSDPA